MAKQPPKRKTRKMQGINTSHMTKVEPLTENQEKIFKAWDAGKHMFIYGCAGTGKTFCVLYKALYDVLKETPNYDAVYLVRSLVPSREIGFLPGDHDDKSSLYQIPYKAMVQRMFEMGNDTEFEMLYSALKTQDTIKFWSTSFLRGVTLDNSVIIIDEMQNLNFHELDSIITRVGENSRIIFCGDAEQTDLKNSNERNGIHDFMRILERLQNDTGEFELIEMDVNDIVRSGLVRNYLLAKRATPLG
jgi:predicted ribonuclease YlaK